MGVFEIFHKFYKFLIAKKLDKIFFKISLTFILFWAIIATSQNRCWCSSVGRATAL